MFSLPIRMTQNTENGNISFEFKCRCGKKLNIEGTTFFGFVCGHCDRVYEMNYSVTALQQEKSDPNYPLIFDQDED